MPWATVLEKVVLVQSSRQLCVVKDLTAHDMVMRLMRKENYLIGMLNKGVLAFPISLWVPGAGPTVKSGTDGSQYRLILTKTLEWTLNWCILQSMFDRYVNYCKNTISCSIIIFSITWPFLKFQAVIFANCEVVRRNRVCNISCKKFYACLLCVVTKILIVFLLCLVRRRTGTKASLMSEAG